MQTNKWEYLLHFSTSRACNKMVCRCIIIILIGNWHSVFHVWSFVRVHKVAFQLKSRFVAACPWWLPYGPFHWSVVVLPDVNNSHGLVICQKAGTKAYLKTLTVSRTQLLQDKVSYLSIYGSLHPDTPSFIVSVFFSFFPFSFFLPFLPFFSFPFSLLLFFFSLPSFISFMYLFFNFKT